MTSDQPITRPIPPPVSIAPLDVWIAIKTVLRRELGEREWEMWIQHARLWRVMSGDTLGVLVPRNGKAAFGSLRYIKRVRSLARKMGYAVMISVEADMEQRKLVGEAFEALDDDDPRKAKLLENWEHQQEFLELPFLEPPCSPLWKERA